MSKQIIGALVLTTIGLCFWTPGRPQASWHGLGDVPSVHSAVQFSDADRLIGHWVCSSVQMPTGLFLFRTFDFRADQTFRSVDSLSERPPVRVWEGSWTVANGMINLNARGWRIGAEDDVKPVVVEVGFGFVEGMKNVFETTIPYSSRPLDLICGLSLDDIMSRHLVDVLAHDIERAQSKN